jgi:PKD repeat protein
MPNSGNATVTLIANDGINGNAYDTVVITSNGININILGPNPVTSNCGASQTLTSQVSGITAGKVYSWSTGSTAASISANAPGTYSVSVTNTDGCSASASVAVQYAGGLNNSVNFTPPPAPICANKTVHFTNTSSDQNNGWNYTWNMGDLGTVNTQNAAYIYANQGIYTVTLVMDSANCTFTSPAHSITVLSANNQQCLSGIEDITFDNAISLLPNPSNGDVNVVINGVDKNLSIKVYNVIGSEVKSFTANDVPSSFSKTFSFGDLASGTYLVKIQSGDKTAVKKLVISK